MIISDLIRVNDAPSEGNTSMPDKFITTNFLYSSLRKQRISHRTISVCKSYSDITEFPSKVVFSIVIGICLASTTDATDASIAMFDSTMHSVIYKEASFISKATPPLSAKLL